MVQFQNLIGWLCKTYLLNLFKSNFKPKIKESCGLQRKKKAAKNGFLFKTFQFFIKVTAILEDSVNKDERQSPITASDSLD